MDQKKKVAVFHWGQISVHTFYLVQQLKRENFDVNVYLYTPVYANKSPYLSGIVESLQGLTTVFEIKGKNFEKNLVKINRLFRFLRLQLPLFCIHPLLPLRTRKVFRPAHYSAIITVKQSSLYWLYKTDRTSISKTLHYSLEAERTSDPNIVAFSCGYMLIKEERRLLSKVRGLIIQDEERAAVVLDENAENLLQKIYFPVSVPGEPIKSKTTYFHEKLNLSSKRIILLYFGLIHTDRLIQNLVEAVEKFSDNTCILVLHGPMDNTAFFKNSPKVKIDEEIALFYQLDAIIASATIGIAFYDNNWPNTRLTAFSSEKIARYLQAGVPFIALNNESYQRLKHEFDCCVLIDEFNELEAAVSQLMAKYDYYRTNCYKAFEKYYRIENTIKPLVKFIESM